MLLPRFNITQSGTKLMPNTSTCSWGKNTTQSEKSKESQSESAGSSETQSPTRGLLNTYVIMNTAPLTLLRTTFGIDLMIINYTPKLWKQRDNA